MKGKIIGVATLFFLFMVCAGGVPFAAPVMEEENPVVVSGIVTAGTVGNKVIFEVRNMSIMPVSGVRMTPQFPLQWSTITDITPKSAVLKPRAERVNENETPQLII